MVKDDNGFRFYTKDERSAMVLSVLMKQIDDWIERDAKPIKAQDLKQLIVNMKAEHDLQAVLVQHATPIKGL